MNRLKYIYGWLRLPVAPTRYKGPREALGALFAADRQFNTLYEAERMSVPVVESRS
jgi:hypothetical protein